MRLKVQPIERAIDFASTVLPTPGTSSSRTCPRHIRAISTRSTDRRLPMITCSTLAATRSATCWISSKDSSVNQQSVASGQSSEEPDPDASPPTTDNPAQLYQNGLDALGRQQI